MNRHPYRRALSVFALCSLVACGGSDPSVGPQDITFAVRFDEHPDLAQGGIVSAPLTIVDADPLVPDDRAAEAQPFTAAVDLRLVGPLPPGVDGDFVPAAVRPNQPGSLELRAGADAQAGRYRLTVAGTLAGGSSTTEFATHQIEVVGNCAPARGSITRIHPSRGGRTLATGGAPAGGFVWGLNAPLPLPRDVPAVFGFYTAQLLPALGDAISIASIRTTSVVVPNRGQVLRLGDYYHSDTGAPGGRAGWVVDGVTLQGGAALQGVQRVVAVPDANKFFVLHDDGTASQLDPVLGVLTPITGLTNVTALAGGDGHLLALRADGTVLAWGDNTFGQLGDGTRSAAATPAPVRGLADVVAIAAGGQHSVALRAGGTALAWGRGDSGQLGNQFTADALAPVEVLSAGGSVVSSVDEIAAGSAHSLARVGSTVWSWGRGGTGQLGNGQTANQTFAAPIGTRSAFITIGAAGDSSFGVQAGGAAWAWGDSADGRLGDGTTSARLVPVAVLGFGRSQGLDCRELPTSDLVFEDVDFADANWRSTPLVATSPGAPPTATAARSPSGGNPGSGAYRRMTHTMPAGPADLQVLHLYQGTFYDPSAQGAITGIDYREDRRVFDDNPLHTVGSQFAIEQDGRVFNALIGSTTTAPSTPQWSSAAVTGLTAALFVQVAGPACPAQQPCPDFGSTGARITFGYWRSTQGGPGDAAFSVAHGIDNWRVTVHRGP